MNYLDRKRAGFTLAELLVATTLMAIVMASVYTLFHTAIRTWRQGDAGYAPYQDARLAMHLLDRDLRNVPRKAMHLFQGTQDGLEFVTVSLPMNVEDDASPRLMWVRYRLTANRGREGRRLLREEAPVVGPLPGVTRNVITGKIVKGDESAFVLAEGVDDFKLTYRWVPPYRSTDAPADIELFAVDQSYAALPTAIDIELAFVEGETPRALRLGASVVPRLHSPMPDAVREYWQRARGGL